MANNIPNSIDIYQKIKTTIFSETSGQIEIEKDLPLRAIAVAQTTISSDIYSTTNNLILQALFPHYSTDILFLKNIAFRDTNNKIRQKQATFSKGNVIVTSTQQVDINSQTEFFDEEENLYKSNTLRSCILQKFVIEELVRLNNVSKAKISNHNLANNLSITITGSIPTSFNGTFTIRLIDKDYIEFDNSGINETASGTIFGEYFGAVIEIVAVNSGASSNKTNTQTISLAQNIDFVENVYITYNGISGGQDIETIDSFKSRIIEFLSKPQNTGNKNSYESFLKQNTDINFVNIFTSEDESKIYLNCIVSKYDATSLDFVNYSSQSLDSFKTILIEENDIILGLSPVDVIFSNPSFVNINISIANLVPNTIDMQSQIKKEIKSYINMLSCKKYLTIDLSELSSDTIKSKIVNIRDSFGNNPNGNISVVVTGANNLTTNSSKPILNNITFA